MRILSTPRPPSLLTRTCSHQVGAFDIASNNIDKIDRDSAQHFAKTDSAFPVEPLLDGPYDPPVPPYVEIHFCLCDHIL